MSAVPAFQKCIIKTCLCKLSKNQINSRPKQGRVTHNFEIECYLTFHDSPFFHDCALQSQFNYNVTLFFSVSIGCTFPAILPKYRKRAYSLLAVHRRIQQTESKHGRERLLYKCDIREFITTWHAAMGEWLPELTVWQDRRVVHR